MPAGDSGPDREDAAVPSPTGEAEGEESVSSGQQGRGTQSEHHRGEEQEASGGEVGHEDEEMTNGSHDLSSSANHSPGSATGSTTASTKRYLSFDLILLFTFAINASFLILHSPNKLLRSWE